ncbi:MAG TPA: GyrI-like domain-containing protein [Actinomycetota bacterium]|nr:GyrI-like domain-containing protein [Actinomycetota bacterium]
MQERRDLYRPSVKEPVLVDVPEMSFLMVDGQGDPNTTPEYAEALNALYAVSYGVKFAVKRSGSADFKVMPLEGLWWSDRMSDFTQGRREGWKWTMMIAQPAVVTEDLVGEATESARKKDLPALDGLVFQRFHEGLCAQIMHVGPYSAEGPTIERLHDFIVEQGFSLGGKHHEIYLGDPRRSAPERLKTVIRQPVAS